MRKSKCGASCRDCCYYDYRELCPGCAIESCLVDLCIKGHSFTGITHPKSFCRLRPYCPIGGERRPPTILIPPLRKKDISKVYEITMELLEEVSHKRTFLKGLEEVEKQYKILDLCVKKVMEDPRVK